MPRVYFFSVICPVCSKVFITNDPRRKYCSRACFYVSIRSIGALEERFWRDVRRCEHDRFCLYCCWEWQGGKTSFGYGQFTFHRIPYMTHVLAYTLWHARVVPQGLCVLHYCDNAPCCSPFHLFLGSANDNVQDAKRKGRLSHGENHLNAKLSTLQVDEILALCVAGGNQYVIAAQFSVTQSCVSAIWRRKSRVNG